MDSQWSNCVDRLLNAWTAYQLAVKMQSGGPDTEAKSQWFYEELCHYALNEKNLDVEDLEDWISQIMYNEFDLILEDNSADWLADSLLKCRMWLETGQLTQLNIFLSSLPSKAAVQQATEQSKTVNDDGLDFDENMNEDNNSEDNNVEDENTSDVDSDQRISSLNSKQRSRQPRMVTDDDGWTTILPRK
uniref:Pre-rRNA-processing protein TSR2 homolog n=1 Tax=Syphacia muris TaxID=451379 RepID=A0A0N5A7U2_9BILA